METNVTLGFFNRSMYPRGQKAMVFAVPGVDIDPGGNISGKDFRDAVNARLEALQKMIPDFPENSNIPNFKRQLKISLNVEKPPDPSSDCEKFADEREAQSTPRQR
ncbi:MAG: hypothetical protein ACRD2L_05330, partial [Terriglobia bacterium]